MRKYDVQELLRQEKNSVYEHLLTIILASIIGISTSLIIIGISSNDYESIILPFSIIILLIFLCLFFTIGINRHKLVKVRNEHFALVTCFDMETFPKPVQFNDYPFSLSVSNNWNSIIANNPTLLEKFRSDHEKNTNAYFYYTNSYTKGFDYKIMSDVVQYFFLRNISPNILQNTIQNKNKKYIRRLFDAILSTRIILFIKQLSRNIGYIDRRFKKDEILNHLHFFSTGMPLILLPNQIKENFFVKKNHQAQLDLEKQILIDGKKVSELKSHTYLPLYIDLPHDIKMSFENSNNSKLDKIIFTKKKVGKLSIEFHDRWREHSQRSFMQTTMVPGYDFHKFEEIFFDLTIDLNVEKYSYFPIIGGGESSVDAFLSWANELIKHIEKTSDWTYYQEHITRDLFQELRNKLGYIEWENRIEYYGNFDQTTNGKFESFYRKLLSPRYPVRKHALENITLKNDQIPTYLLEKIILRIIQLTKLDIHTVFIALDTLDKLAHQIPANIHEHIINRLFSLLENKEVSTKLKTLECLAEMTKYIVDPTLKGKVHKIIIELHVLKAESIFPVHSQDALKKTYPTISMDEKEKLEKKYLIMLNSNNSEELTQALIFFSCVIDFISDEMADKLFNQISRIDVINFDVNTIEEYFIFLSAFCMIKNHISLNEKATYLHYQKIISLIENSDDELRRISIVSIKKCGLFISRLNKLKRNVIFSKLKINVYIKNHDLNFLTLDTICYLAKHLPGEEEEIAKMMLQKVNPHSNDYYFQKIVSIVCFDYIKNKVTDVNLLKDIEQFQDITKDHNSYVVPN